MSRPIVCCAGHPLSNLADVAH